MKLQNFSLKGLTNFAIPKKLHPSMSDHVMCQWKPPERLGQKGEPITVGDKVRVRDDKTTDH